MPDYNSLIDEQTWAFIKDTQAWYPEDTIDRTVAEQRAIYDRMCRAFFSGYPAGVSARDDSADGVPVRVYEATREGSALVLYLHGGGFVVGGLESHDDVCAEICERTGLRVVSVDYRLCPEHTHPAAIDDAETTLRWVHSRFGLPVVVCGDSAGGNLAAALCHGARGTDLAPVGQVLIYPGLGADPERDSYREHSEAPLLHSREVLYYGEIRRGDTDAGSAAADPRYAPLADTDFSGLPPTTAISADCDPLRDDCRDYVAAVNAAGGEARWINEAGLVHGYLRARTTVARAQASFERIIAAIEGAVPGG